MLYKCVGAWLLVCTLVLLLLPVFIVGRVLAHDETELQPHVSKENLPLPVNMDLVQSASKEDQLSVEESKKSLVTTMINGPQLQHDLATAFTRVDDVQEQRILLRFFADYVDPGSNTNPGAGVADAPISPPPLPP